MVELWKAKRELLRVWLKIYDKLNIPIDQMVQKRYDATFQSQITLTECHQNPKDKIAIFFIYQPKGFSKSIFVTCKYLKSLGYSILLVSSTPITVANRDVFKGLCWKIVERRNYGYDFGGYRDGIRLLHESGINPRLLLIMNDSIWFPIYKGSQMLENMERSDFLMNGLVFENKPGRSDRHKHFQSYFMLLKSKAVDSDAFRNYWRYYRVSSKKRIVLKRGEKGFTYGMNLAGFVSDTQSTRSILLEQIHEQTNDFLLKTLTYAAYANREYLSEARFLIQHYADTIGWREKALLHIETAIATSQPMGIFCYASIKILDSTFLKKSSYPIEYDGMRWQYLRAVNNGDLPAPHPDILAEIMASKMDGSLTTDPSISTPVSATKAK